MHDYLETLVGSALADPAVQTDRLLEALVERCLNSAPELTATLARACFYAEELRHYLKHRSVFDQAYREAGDSGVHMLAMYTMPCGSLDPLGSLAETIPDARAAADALARLSGQFQPRLPPQRLEHQLLVEVLPRLNMARFTANLPALAEVLHWGYYADVPHQMFVTMLSHSRWQEDIFTLPLEKASSLAYALSRVSPEEYASWYKRERQQIVSYFKWHSRTLTVREEDGTVQIKYAVDWSPGAPSPNEQSVSRIYALSRLLPDYDTYSSRGIHLLGEDIIIGHDETEKHLARETIWQEVDSSKNGDWTQLCQQKYATDSLTNWLTSWEGMRQRSLSLVEQLCETYDRLYREQTLTQKRKDEVNGLVNDLQQSFLRTPVLPMTLASRERTHLNELMSDWKTHFSSFVRQYTEHNPRSLEDHYSRLMRINLKKAQKALPDLNEALDAVAKTLGRDTPTATDLPRETAAYQRLADFLDYWFEGGTKYLPHPNRAMAEWRREQRTQFLAEIHRCCQPLEAAGFKFMFPTQELIDYPLTSICLGVEVQDFLTFDNTVVEIALALDNVTSKFDYLQIVPTVGSRQYQRKVLRMGQDSIRTLAQGELPDRMWLFPVDPPEGIQDVLPGLQFDPLPELDLINEFYDSLGRMTSQTRLNAIASQLLQPSDEFEARLLEEIRSEGSVQRGQAWQDLQTSLHKMDAFRTRVESEQEWREMTRRTQEVAAEARSSCSASLEPFKIDWKFQRLCMIYLNKALLQPQL